MYNNKMMHSAEKSNRKLHIYTQFTVLADRDVVQYCKQLVTPIHEFICNFIDPSIALLFKFLLLLHSYSKSRKLCFSKSLITIRGRFSSLLLTAGPLSLKQKLKLSNVARGSLSSLFSQERSLRGASEEHQRSIRGAEDEGLYQ